MCALAAMAATVLASPSALAARADDEALPAAAPSACVVDTTLPDFLGGTGSGVDLESNPGGISLPRSIGPNPEQLWYWPDPLYGYYDTLSPLVGRGQTFTPSVTGAVTKIEVTLACMVQLSGACSGATPDLVVAVRATAGGVPIGGDLATATIPGFSSPAPTMREATFATPLIVSAGVRYAFVIQPVAHPDVGFYRIPLSAQAGIAMIGIDTYAGGDYVSQSPPGSTWGIATMRSFSVTDAVFRVTIDRGYAASGNFVSRVIANDAPGVAVPHWSPLTFGATVPASTAVRFQAAASDSVGGPYEFVGPDGTSSSYFTGSGDSLAAFDGKRFLRYRAFLDSADPSRTPVLEDVSICFSADGGGTDVAAAMASTPDPVAPGSMLRYTISIANHGPDPAQSVTWTDTLPADTSFASVAAPPGWSCITPTIGIQGTVQCSTASMSPGSVEFGLDVSVPPVSLPLLLSNTVQTSFPGIDWNASNDSATVVTTVSPDAGARLLDADANGGYDALTDGLLILRHLFGLGGLALVNNALGPGATRTDPAAIAAWLHAHAVELDVDGDGRADALSDGLMIVRYLFGLGGDTIIADALSTASRRHTAAEIVRYLNALSR